MFVLFIRAYVFSVFWIGDIFKLFEIVGLRDIQEVRPEEDLIETVSEFV